MKIIALEESFWYDKLATEGSTARAWLQLKSAVAADWQRKLVDFTEYRLPDMDRNGVDMQVLSLNSPGIQGTSLTITSMPHESALEAGLLPTGDRMAACSAGRVRAMDNDVIRVAGLATRVACRRMTPRYLKALSDSID